MVAVTPSRVRRIAGQAPITPEIARAYENDPRSQIARVAINNGTSGGPVAQGQYAWADAAARTMSAALGGWQDRRMRNQYGEQDDLMVAERAANAQRALDEQTAVAQAKGMPGAPPPGANVNPAQATTIAAAMGAPAPATAPTAATPNTAPSAPPIGLAGLPMGAPPQASAPPPAAPPMGPPVQRPAPVRPQPQGVVFTDPLAGTGRVTSAYGATRPNGRTHNGRDLAAPSGTPIGAAAEGRVLRAWNDTANGGGNSVLIRHADGSTTGYAHLADFGVRSGDTVAAGQPIGTVGSTGRSSGPHLHFTYRDARGRRVDPATLQYGQPQASAAPEASADVATELPPVDVQATPGAAADYGIPREEMPTAPQPVGATRSRGLTNGYELAAAGNPYESARAQGLITAGLDQQTELDEADAARRNDTNNIGYRASLDRYGNDRTQIRSQRYGTAERLGSQEFNRDERLGSQEFTAGENGKQRAWGTDERMGSQQFQAGQNSLDRAATRSNLELQTGSREEIARQRALSTPSASRLINAANEAVQANSNAVSRIDEFLAINQERNTGHPSTLLPGAMATFGDQRLQRMEAIGNQLTTDLSQALKGALSDKDIEFLRNGGLSIRRTREANAQTGAFMRRAAQRGSDFQVARVDALGRGDRNFTRDWAAYTNAVPLEDNAPSFDEWKASVPSFDAQGRPIR